MSTGYSGTLKKILSEAGGLLMEGFSAREVQYDRKGSIDLVTYWDRKIEEFLKAALLDAFPGHGFIGEESGTDENEGKRVFIVDPIDGTTNFVHGFPFCCISIACVERSSGGDRLLAGGIHAPVLGEMYLGETGKGATCNGQPLAVSTQKELGDSLFVTGFNYERRAQKDILIRILENGIDHTQGVRRTGSAALDLCYVARGIFDSYIETGIHAWDIAAGALFVREAGGQVSLFDGGPLDIFAREIVASNGELHDRVLSRLLDGVPGWGETKEADG